MSSRSLRGRKLHFQTGATTPTDEQMPKWNYKFAKHTIEHFQTSKAAYVQPFLQPVHEEADNAPGYYKEIDSPMDLSTMMQELESGKYRSPSDVQKSFERMFANCFTYNSPATDVHRKGKYFERTFLARWNRKNDWISTQADLDELSEVDDEDDSDEKRLYDTSDDDPAADINESLEANGSSDEHSLEDNRTSDEELPIRRRPYVLQTDDSDEDVPLEKPVRKNRARKSRIPRLPVDPINAASIPNANNKRPLDTESGTETSTSSSPQQQTPITDQSTEEQTTTSSQTDVSSAEQESAKRRRLESEAESPSETPTQAPTRQPRTQQPAEMPQRQPSPEESVFDKFKASSSNLVAEQINSHINHISANVEGEFDQHRSTWNLICRNELRPAFERAWKAKAMDNIMNNLGVQEQVERAYAKTAVEQVKAFLNRATQNAAALERSVGRHGGGTSDA